MSPEGPTRPWILAPVTARTPRRRAAVGRCAGGQAARRTQTDGRDESTADETQRRNAGARRSTACKRQAWHRGRRERLRTCEWAWASCRVCFKMPTRPREGHARPEAPASSARPQVKLSSARRQQTRDADADAAARPSPPSTRPGQAAHVEGRCWYCAATLAMRRGLSSSF